MILHQTGKQAWRPDEVHDVVEWQLLMAGEVATFILMLVAGAAVTSAVDCCHMV